MRREYIILVTDNFSFHYISFFPFCTFPKDMILVGLKNLIFEKLLPDQTTNRPKDRPTVIQIRITKSP